MERGTGRRRRDALTLAYTMADGAPSGRAGGAQASAGRRHVLQSAHADVIGYRQSLPKPRGVIRMPIAACRACIR